MRRERHRGTLQSRHRRRATTDSALAPLEATDEDALAAGIPAADAPDIGTTETGTPDHDSPDAGSPEADTPEVGPLRRCIVTRERLAKERMIRFVIGPGRRVVPDLAERLPGRGIWLSAAGDVVQTARLRGAFARAARGPVTVPHDLLEMLQAALVRRIGEGLGLARRAGQAIAGFEKAREWLRDGRAGLVVQAADGSTEERGRFLSAARGTVTVHTPLSAAALGVMFGRDRAVHVVVAPGALADRIGFDCTRLAGLAPGLAANDKVDPADFRQRGVQDV
jgi:predicted RNA-binding protein YlxR (DUF448 family)